MKNLKKIIKNHKEKTSTLKKGFSCIKCGYDAYKLAKFSYCPLCIICKGCNTKVGKCKCKDGE